MSKKKYAIRLLYNYCPFCKEEGLVQRLGVFVPIKSSQKDIKNNIQAGKVKDIAYCNSCKTKMDIDFYKKGLL